MADSVFTSIAYDLFMPPRIVFGWGRRVEAGELAASLGRRAFLVTGSRTLAKSGRIAEIEANLRQQGLDVIPLTTISREPEVTDVDDAVRSLLSFDVHAGPAGDLILSVGGGSAIDLAKAVSAMATNRQGESVADFLEGVGRGLKIETPPLPLMAMPTTAGTGSEATKNAVISSYDPPFKKSLRSEMMVPRVVLVDPELTQTVPAEITAQTGMDAITQLIESAISLRSKPVPRALCLQGIPLACAAILEAVENGASRTARERMSHAALLSGIALANSGLGMAHGVAAALGVHCRTPHGLACAVMLPTALRVNRVVSRATLAEIGRTLMREDEGPITDSTAVDETAVDETAVDEVAVDETAVNEVVNRIESISRRIGIPRTLAEIGVERAQIPAIVKSSRGNSMRGNPREISDDELSGILESML